MVLLRLVQIASSANRQPGIFTGLTSQDQLTERYERERFFDHGGGRHMKILMTADTVGGVWAYAMELRRAMPEHEFLIETLEGSRLEWMDDPWDDVDRDGECLLEIERRESPDVIHLNGYAHAALPFRAPKLVVAHFDLLSWWRAVKGERPPASCNTYRSRVEEGLRAADFIVAPSRAMLNALRDNYDFRTPSRIIYNGATRQLTTGERDHVVF